jgi:hypothetical protein
MTGGMAIGLVGLVPQTAEASVQQNSRVVNNSEKEDSEDKRPEIVGQFYINLTALIGGLVTVTIGLVIIRSRR